MIVCGHALIGKSTICKDYGIALDLESSIFCKGDFEQYVEYIKALDNETRVIFTSCHIPLRKELLKQGIEYTLVLPDKSEKERYMKLNDARQPHPLKTEIIDKCWDSWQEILENEKVVHLEPGEQLSYSFLAYLGLFNQYESFEF